MTTRRVVLNLKEEDAVKLEAFLYAHNQPEHTTADIRIEQLRERLQKTIDSHKTKIEVEVDMDKLEAENQAIIEQEEKDKAEIARHHEEEFSVGAL